MSYYRIHFTLNPKLRGSNEYIKDYELLIPDKKIFWEEPKFIGNIFNEKIEFEPYLLNIVLNSKSKLHDLILDGGPISLKYIFSSRLKDIIEEIRITGIQFFQINVIHNLNKYNNYWILNMYQFNQEYIDLSNSIIIHEKKSDDFDTSYNVEEVNVKFNNLIEFNNYRQKVIKNEESIQIKKIGILKDVKEDFFALNFVEGGIGYYVSEKLKMTIEDAGCTGIEFQPIELSYNEWTAPKGEREKNYGKIH